MMPPFSRRHLLSSGAAGFGWLAFNGLFARNAAAAANNPLLPKKPHFPARAKRVIFLYLSGGPSQVDTFDYKPALTKQHNKPVSDKSPTVYYQSPWKFAPRGESGMLTSDLLPHIAR